ncbi:MAG: proton-dependent oligopeptide transporter family [Pedosphaera sp.]|nr:proton-dependent oligopeptide transporter family [Pedosphaera sp.]
METLKAQPPAGPNISKAGYITAPLETTKMPSGVPYIVGNELAERFSFYGMRAILVVFMTKYLVTANGAADHMTDSDADGWFHLFVASAYFFPLLGAIIADVFLGKYMTIMSLSVVYCLGHLALALNDTRFGLAVGLSLIAIGSGGIKPCVSANVGDQFGATNRHLLTKVYSWFYFSINVGSAISMLWIPKLLDDKRYGPHVAFGVPGFLMLLATVVFWLGRRKFVHVQPRGGRPVQAEFRAEGIRAIPKLLGEFWREVFATGGLKVLISLLPIYACIAVFWSLYDQCSSKWVQQADKMDLHWLGRDWQPAQLQAINPLLILIYIPLFTYIIYPVLNKIFPLTPLRKMSIGFFFTTLSWVVPAWVEMRIGAGFKPTIAWQFLAYTFLMASEIMVYATGLEFSYTQAPKRMKSMVMSLFLLTNSVGNLFTSAVNFLNQNEDKTTKLAGASYYFFFAGLMFLTAIIFILVAKNYRSPVYSEQTQKAPA